MFFFLACVHEGRGSQALTRGSHEVTCGAKFFGEVEARLSERLAAHRGGLGGWSGSLAPWCPDHMRLLPFAW